MNRACLRFRAAFTPVFEGSERSPHPHRAVCADCAAYAAALERAAAVRQSLPDGLRERLRAIPRQPLVVEEAVPLRLAPLSAVPLPEELRSRLRAIPREATAAAPRPPLWLLRARYAVAASYLLVVLTGAAFGNPLDLGRRATRSVAAPLARSLAVAQGAGEARLVRFARLGAAAERVLGRVQRRLDAVRHGLESRGRSALESLDEMPFFPSSLPPSPAAEAPDERPGGPDAPAEENHR